ncbi:MAG: 2-oxoglutarate dehydrogenase complex dihydrolipoyllysine-residue succinyltransferase [Myxococcales bacterium]|nr:2-oxoglutarate dehydrogenase complex dihydrolipoyllysine-residue succinyltransferase [Myxococcales bacterium]
MADLRVPPLGESITEAVIGRWLKNPGDAVADGEPVVELETDKITVQLPSPVAGVLAQQTVEAGATVRVDDLVGTVTAGAVAVAQPPAAAAPSAPAAAPPRPAAAASTPVAPATAAPVPATPPPRAAAPTPALDEDALLRLPPSQRRLARERGELPAEVAPAAAPAARPAAPAPVVHPGDEVVAMSPLRKRIAERLVQAQHESASLTTFNEVDMTAIMDLRATYKDAFEKAHGVKLGFMSFFVRACVSAAKAFPGLNAELAGDKIIYKKRYDFGIAVQTPKGLVVPVLRGCDQLDFAGVERGIAALADKARTGKLAIDDLTGGTFSISNGGIYGSMMSTPLLNYPQTGILGMHNIVKRPMVVGDAIAIRPVMYVAVTYDHRVVDGREAVSFLVAVKDRLEAPDRLLLGL